MAELLSPVFTWRSAIASGESGLSPTQRLVALVLSLHMSERGDSCFPKVQTIAEEAGLNGATVRKAIGALETEGWLLVERPAEANGKQANRYSAAMPARLIGDVIPGEGSPCATPGVAVRDPSVEHVSRPTSTPNGVDEIADRRISEEAKSEVEARRRKIFGALVEAFGLSAAAMPEGQRKFYGRCAGELVRAGALPEQVPFVVRHLREVWKLQSFTPRAVVKHWAQAAEELRAARRQGGGEYAQYEREALTGDVPS